jgi:NAD(P)-dependent dehydrogenase (short-subunit alcohol dehydrogenase family)
VLVNNAGVVTIIPDYSLPALRKTINDMLNINLTSVAVISSAFQNLLHKAAKPKVINITSGLGSIENTLKHKMVRYTPYGVSKVGLNGVTAHMQAAENDRIKTEEAKGKAKDEGRIRFYSVAPGFLKRKIEFTNYGSIRKDPKDGAEVIVRLIADDEGLYEGGTHYEFENGEMRLVPW